MAVIRKNFKTLLVTLCVLMILFFLFRVWLAGCARQARFNVMALYQAIEQYKQANGEYPEKISDLKKFYIVSTIDRLYCDWKSFSSGRFKGYAYNFSRIDHKKFVLLTSPVRFQYFLPEFGIIEDGRLRVHRRHVDSEGGGVEEVKTWRELKNTLFSYNFNGQ